MLLRPRTRQRTHHDRMPRHPATVRTHRQHVWCLPVSQQQQHHGDVIKWKHFPQYLPFVRGIYWSPVTSPHKSQWRRALCFLWSAPQQMEALSPLPAFCGGIHRSPVDSPHKESGMRSFNVYFVASLDKLLNKQFSWRLSKTPWRPCDVTALIWQWIRGDYDIVCMCFPEPM